MVFGDQKERKKQTMDIRSLAREDIEGLYHAHMTNDFPAAERKPLEVLLWPF